MAYVALHHIKLAHILPVYDAYLNLDEEMIAKAPIVDGKSNLKLNQENLNIVYLDYQCDTFKVNNALVCEILIRCLWTQTHMSM